MIITDQLPSQQEATLAKLCSQELSGILDIGGEHQEISFKDDKGVSHSVEIPKSALNLLVEVLTQLGQGNIVKITPIHAELTTQEGADLLNMSRPTFIKLLDNEEIPYTRTGNRRKVAYSDVAGYKQKLFEKRLATLSELSALDQEEGLDH